MKRVYLAAIGGHDGAYSAVFLDLPGCTSAGTTLAEVRSAASEALRGHIEVTLDAGESIPDPTIHDIDAVERWLANGDQTSGESWVGMWPVEVDIPERQDLVTIRMKAALVERIAHLSEVTVEHLDSRRFIEQAIEHEIERYRKSAA